MDYGICNEDRLDSANFASLFLWRHALIYGPEKRFTKAIDWLWGKWWRKWSQWYICFYLTNIFFFFSRKVKICCRGKFRGNFFCLDHRFWNDPPVNSNSWTTQNRCDRGASIPSPSSFPCAFHGEEKKKKRKTTRKWGN